MLGYLDIFKIGTVEGWEMSIPRDPEERLRDI
jgi:hypothetical protein